MKSKRIKFAKEFCFSCPFILLPLIHYTQNDFYTQNEYKSYFIYTYILNLYKILLLEKYLLVNNHEHGYFYFLFYMLIDELKMDIHGMQI